MGYSNEHPPQIGLWWVQWHISTIFMKHYRYNTLYINQWLTRSALKHHQLRKINSNHVLQIKSFYASLSLLKKETVYSTALLILWTMAKSSYQQRYKIVCCATPVEAMMNFQTGLHFFCQWELVHKFSPITTIVQCSVIFKLPPNLHIWVIEFSLSKYCRHKIFTNKYST